MAVIRQALDPDVVTKLAQEEKATRRKDSLVLCNSHFVLELTGVGGENVLLSAVLHFSVLFV